MIGQVLGGAAVMHRRAEYALICAASGIFFLGALVYLFDRSGSDIYFILLTRALLTPWQLAAPLFF
jgi:hypothetical protein